MFVGSSLAANRGIDFWVDRAEPSKVANSTPCRIYYIKTDDLAAEGSAFGEFDSFVDEFEATPSGGTELAAGRKWVAEQFYSGEKSLANLRLAAGLSQKQLAELCGLEQPHVSRYESGKHEPQIGIAAKMASALGVSMDVFTNAWLVARMKADCDNGIAK